MAFEINSRELSQAMAGIKHLPDQLKRDTIHRYIRIVAHPLANKAKANAPKKSGGLAQSIGIIISKSKTRPGLIIGPKISRGGYHGAILEKGTQERHRKIKGRKVSTGSGPAKNYMAQTMAQNAATVGPKMEKQIIKAIQKGMQKYGYKLV